ncbi:FAD-binding oxidoreductase [Ferviditalea candida]|uniref:D-lactate dehydrogenase (cytochrome) n=1 Tax=Ferviditalea candida TaxID=3108399 RepID=A0ABU5ZII5_9BACL|nr:FAD-linked oxidase C-terminal domain-containing protein [Paenibacillaceae bacterium T2]
MDLVNELRRILPAEQVSTNATVLEQHSKDESYHTPHLPDVVVFPKTAEEVSRVLAFADKHSIPVVPFGVGSSLEGHVIPYEGGISLDMQLMNRILDISPDDFLVTVQPGVTRLQLNKELKRYGLFFSVDPGADATLGGMAATNASGTTAVRYGVMRDQVRDLEVVLADGRIIHTGRRSPKSSSGYNLTGLFVGSEGTLGVFTELTLKVYGIPESVMAARASFPSVESAVKAAASILSNGIPVARIELLDQRSIQQINIHNHTSYPEQPALFLEFHGSAAGMDGDMENVKELCAEEGSQEFVFASDAEERTRLWEARHNLAYAFVHHSRGKQQMSTDVCVPLSELPGAVLYARKMMDEYGLDGGLLGHVGDGNYHALILVDPDDPDELERALKVNSYLVEYALSRGGTCTGEHGVGVGKVKYQRQEFGEAIEIMRSIKLTLDPNGILNPGKIFPVR